MTRIRKCEDGRIMKCPDGRILICPAVPDTCPDLPDEYKVEVCGHTFTVDRPVLEDACAWGKGVDPVAGCGMTINNVMLEGDSANNKWTLRVEEFPSTPYKYCDYEKQGGTDPTGNYTETDNGGGTTCGSATVTNAP